MVGLLAEDVEHDVWGEIELVEEEGIRMDYLKIERVENVPGGSRGRWP